MNMESEHSELGSQGDEAEIPSLHLPFPKREHPEDAPLSSLDVVEDFFGEELSDEVISKAGRLPAEQADELRQRLDANFLRLRIALGYRRQPFPIYSQVKMTFASDIESVRNVDICAHEAPLFKAGIETGMANVGVLKHLALYCERVLVNDPLAFPFQQPIQQWTYKLGPALRELLDIAEFVRSRWFIPSEIYLAPQIRLRPFDLSAGNSTEWLKNLLEEQPRLVIGVREILERHGIDPLARDLRDSVLARPESRVEIEADILDWYKKGPAAEARAGDITGRELLEVGIFYGLVQAYALTPITSSQSIIRYGEEYARELLDSSTESATSGQRFSSLSPAVSYGIPSLDKVSFADISRIRKNEKVFAQVRASLTELGRVCAESALPDSYQAYKATVHEHAEDIVRPTYERLRKWQHKARYRKWGLQLGVMSAAIGIQPLVTPAGPIVGEIASNTVERMGGRLLGRETRRTFEDTGIALGILKSILDY